MNEQKNEEAISSEGIQQLEERLVKAYIAQDFTIASYKSEDIVFIQGKKGEIFADIVMTIAGASEMVETIQKLIEESKDAKQSGELDSLAQP
jgi:hypothetical protein